MATIEEALLILRAVGMPREQQNERSALTLLGLLDLKPADAWADVRNPLRGITELMSFFEREYGRKYAPNTRETVRRFSMHQLVQAGVVIENPDRPTRPINSPKWCYQVSPAAFSLFSRYGTARWAAALDSYLQSVGSLTAMYVRERDMQRIPILLPGETTTITLSPGGQNDLVKRIIEEFCPRFTPGGRVLYVGDAGEKWAIFDEALLAGLGVTIDAHGKMPDVVIYQESRGWLFLIEAVTSHGPVNPKRHLELHTLFEGSSAGLVFVTAFETRQALGRYLGEIAWETEVWVAENPTHMIHFDGDRFLGPYGGDGGPEKA